MRDAAGGHVIAGSALECGSGACGVAAFCVGTDPEQRRQLRKLRCRTPNSPAAGRELRLAPRHLAVDGGVPQNRLDVAARLAKRDSLEKLRGIVEGVGFLPGADVKVAGIDAASANWRQGQNTPFSISWTPSSFRVPVMRQSDNAASRSSESASARRMDLPSRCSGVWVTTALSLSGAVRPTAEATSSASGSEIQRTRHLSTTARSSVPIFVPRSMARPTIKARKTTCLALAGDRPSNSSEVHTKAHPQRRWTTQERVDS